MQNTVKRSNLELLFACIIVVGSFAFLIIGPKQTQQAYNCSISEISPDYPPEVKEQCRKLRAEKFNKDLQKPK